MRVTYLSQNDVSLLLGRDRQTVRIWRTRFPEGSELAFPAPDVEVGLGLPTPGWLPDRMPEIIRWCKDRGFKVSPQPDAVTRKRAAAGRQE